MAEILVVAVLSLGIATASGNVVASQLGESAAESGTGICGTNEYT